MCDKHQARQGDLLFTEFKATLPKDAKKIDPAPQYVVAMGEATGHAHVLEGEDVDLWEDEDGTLYIGTKGSGAIIQHDEHGPVTLEPNKTYEMKRQRQATNDEEWMRVRD